MKKILLLALLSAAAIAGDYNITTGSNDGFYKKVGVNLKKALAGNNVRLINSKGSLENLQRLQKGEANVGIVQKDALSYYLIKHPELEVEEISDLRDECLMMVVNKYSPIKDEDDLQSNKKWRVGVGNPQGGTNITWLNMQRLEPGYKKSLPVYASGTRALNQLVFSSDKAAKEGAKNITEGKINVLLKVMTPNLTTTFFKRVNNNPQLHFVDVNDGDLDDTLNGKPVYNIKTITVKKGVGLFSSDEKVKTICTTSVLVVRKDMPEEDKQILSDILYDRKSMIVGK